MYRGDWCFRSGLGVCLGSEAERWNNIAYASRTLQTHEKNYSVTELETLALVWSVKHFRHCLYGHHCDVYTDHEPLRSLLNTPHPSGKLAHAKIHEELGKHYWWSGDTIKWCRGCLTCASMCLSTCWQSDLTSINSNSSVETIWPSGGVDILKLPKYNADNQYAVVFVDYLTKWPGHLWFSQPKIRHGELLVTKITVHRELLSDRKAVFLSHLVKSVCQLIGTHQINTTSYHP